MHSRRLSPRLPLFLFIAALLCVISMTACDDTSVSAGSTTWLIKPGSMSLAILVSDYLSYTFEEGTLDHYPDCGHCDDDGLPFSIRFNSPGDFGDITFHYTETGDTLFHGTIVWLGTGRIEFPASFTPAGEFEAAGVPPGDPLSIEYFNISPQLDEETFKAQATLAWNRVKDLDIVGEFAKGEYRVGIYLYAPAVGVFVPDLAKWIVFLHRQKHLPSR
jgi:hypothetical protein